MQVCRENAVTNAAHCQALLVLTLPCTAKATHRCPPHALPLRLLTCREAQHSRSKVIKAPLVVAAPVAAAPQAAAIQHLSPAHIHHTPHTNACALPVLSRCVLFGLRSDGNAQLLPATGDNVQARPLVQALSTPPTTTATTTTTSTCLMWGCPRQLPPAPHTHW